MSEGSSESKGLSRGPGFSFGYENGRVCGCFFLFGFRFLSVFNGLKGGDRDGYFGVSEVKWVAVKAVVSVMEVGWDRCALLRVWTVREEIGGH